MMDHNYNCEKNSLCFARYHLETTITVISFSVLQIALLHLLISSVTLYMHKRIPFSFTLTVARWRVP